MNALSPPDFDHAQDRAELIGIVTALFALLSLVSRLPVGALSSARVLSHYEVERDGPVGHGRGAPVYSTQLGASAVS